ncbi:hypothetical protein D3C85_1756500 [compost metagenome]
MPAENSACSITRDCALLRYRIAISARLAPCAIWSRISSMIQPASWPSVPAWYTRTGSPWPASVRRFLPRRRALCEIRWLAESRICPCER